MKKLKIALMGESGRMGQAAKEAIDKDDRFILYNNTMDSDNCVMIDFSHKSTLKKHLSLSLKNLWPAVICTTGHDEANFLEIKKASLLIPVLYAPNTSLGANLMANLVQKAYELLWADDISIIETHHKHKKDAPSGTALMLKERAPTAQIISIRAAQAQGEHRIKFFSQSEDLEIIHRSYNREVFAHGALKAALFLLKKEPGLYNMADVLKIA